MSGFPAGHIDDITRFINTETVVTVIEEDESDANFGPLMDNYERLCRMTTEDDSPLNIVTLPMPKPVIDDGIRLPASYANFLIVNGAVLVPVYADPADAVALAALARCFPGRRVEPLNCLALIQQNGSLHCATMQLPMGVLKQDEVAG